MRISIVIPALNEASCIRETLAAVTQLRPFEIIVADGGSADRTANFALEFAVVVQSERGRGAQQRAAARVASGDAIWFLHADTIPTPGALDAIIECLRDPRVAGGNFSLIFDGDSRAARRLTRIYPYLRWLGLCYGDSGIFIRKTAYDAVGGFKPIPLFEDVDLVRRLRRIGTFSTLTHKLLTSSRRFEHCNFAVMFAEWTSLQLLFLAGVSPHRLAGFYKSVRKPEGTA